MELDNTLIRLYDFIVINMECDVNKGNIQGGLRWVCDFETAIKSSQFKTLWF